MYPDRIRSVVRAILLLCTGNLTSQPTNVKSSRHEGLTDIIINSLSSRIRHIRISFTALARAHVVEMCPDLADST